MRWGTILADFYYDSIGLNVNLLVELGILMRSFVEDVSQCLEAGG